MSFSQGTAVLNRYPLWKYIVFGRRDYRPRPGTRLPSLYGEDRLISNHWRARRRRQ